MQHEERETAFFLWERSHKIRSQSIILYLPKPLFDNQIHVLPSPVTHVFQHLYQFRIPVLVMGLHHYHIRSHLTSRFDMYKVVFPILYFPVKCWSDDRDVEPSAAASVFAEDYLEIWNAWIEEAEIFYLRVSCGRQVLQVEDGPRMRSR